MEAWGWRRLESEARVGSGVIERKRIRRGKGRGRGRRVLGNIHFAPPPEQICARRGAMAVKSSNAANTPYLNCVDAIISKLVRGRAIFRGSIEGVLFFGKSKRRFFGWVAV